MTTAGEGIEHAAAELDVSERAVSEYLRDYFNAEVARSNLAVQRAVHRLTVVAILIAVIALLMQFIQVGQVIEWIRHLVAKNPS